MKRFLAILACIMLLPAVAFGATDKKDDKKGGKDNKGGDKPIIITWDFDWKPIIRDAE